MSLLTCEQAIDVISGVRNQYGEVVQSEIIQTVKDSSESGCDWDANVD